MPKIFISHSSQDNDFAAKLADALRERGAEVWIDLTDIPAGMKWSKAIQQGLDWGELMLLIVTPDSMASENVADEWEYYHQKKKTIIPLWRTPVEMPFQLHRYQYVDFHQRDFEAALTKLGAELTRLGFALSESPLNPLSQGRVDLPAAPALLRPERGAKGEADTRQFPLIIKPEWVGKIIPEPFEWCVVPAGQVTLAPSGSDEDYLKHQQTFHVSEFQIARYPITNAQFAAFLILPDGWRDPQWWTFSEAAKKWRAENRKPKAIYLANNGNHPRVDVTWYASVAFTRWLSAKTGEKIALPAEQQWQRAAQGDDGRVYPWGDNWDSSLCNSRESGIGQTTPVTRYLGGASPFGILDMSGNVWDWCATSIASGTVDLNGTDIRVVRGGSWNLNQDNARTVVRYGRNPSNWYDGFGFRVVRGAFPI